MVNYVQLKDEPVRNWTCDFTACAEFSLQQQIETRTDNTHIHNMCTHTDTHTHSQNLSFYTAIFSLVSNICSIFVPLVLLSCVHARSRFYFQLSLSPLLSRSISPSGSSYFPKLSSSDRTLELVKRRLHWFSVHLSSAWSPAAGPEL